MDVWVGQSFTFCTLLGSGWIPSLDMMCSRNSTWSWVRRHLAGFSFRPLAWNRERISFRCCRCFPRRNGCRWGHHPSRSFSSEAPQYILHYSLECHWSIGQLTSLAYSSHPLVNAVFSRSLCSTCQYPCWRSTVENQSEPDSPSKASLTRCRGLESFDGLNI